MKSLAERFWAKVDRRAPDECWPWLAGKNESGYGRFSPAGRRVGAKLAHRVAWELRHGSPPSALVLHRCDNPACVNPGHLFLGNHADNMRDAKSKGRLCAGERRARFSRGDLHPQSRLDATDARLIRFLRTVGASGVDVADWFGISPSHVSCIHLGKLWRCAA